MTTNKKLYWALFAATMIVYGAMLLWSLPNVSTQAAGLIPFDLRPGGYSFEDAQTFVTALTPEGAAFYLGTQHLLDLFYPAMIGLVVLFALWHLSATWPTWLRLVLAAVPILSAVFDYLENNAVTKMVTAGPDGLTADLVASASQWTLLKSGFSTVGMTAVVALLVANFVRKRIGGGQE